MGTAKITISFDEETKKSIDSLAEQLERFTIALREEKSGTSETGSTEDTDGKATKAKATSKKTSTRKPRKSTTKSTGKDSKSAASKGSDAPSISLEDLQTGLKTFIEKNGKQKAIALLGNHNLQKLSDAKSDQYADIAVDLGLGG